MPYRPFSKYIRLSMPINYDEYPPNWLTEIRPRILHRANHACERCGARNYSTKANGTKVILTIAHLDHDKANWEVTDDRLQALCQSCHLSYDAPRHARNRRYGRNHMGKQQLKLPGIK